MVANYPLTNWNEREATNKDIKYPMAGMTARMSFGNLRCSFWVKVTILDWRTKDQYLTMVSWEPRKTYFYWYFESTNKNHLKFNKYDVGNRTFVKHYLKKNNLGRTTTSVNFLYPITSQFIYQTDFFGFNQMYLYNTDGKLLKT